MDEWLSASERTPLRTSANVVDQEEETWDKKIQCEGSRRQCDGLPPSPFSYEFNKLLSLTGPTIVVNLGWTVPNFLVASFIGTRFSVVDLDGFSLASMTSNLCTLTLLSGLYSASDTLSPQAYGIGNKLEVGHIAVRGMMGSFVVLVPTILFLNLFMNAVLLAVGQDASASLQAWRWYQIYSMCLPFHALYGFVWKFLSAQNVMYPLVISSVFSTVIILPVGLQWSTTYRGTAYAVVVYEVFQSLLVLIILWIQRPYDTCTWPGFAQVWKNSLRWKSFATFMVGFFIGQCLLLILLIRCWGLEAC
jgi:Na+-driven multidrug efflux pump